MRLPWIRGKGAPGTPGPVPGAPLHLWDCHCHVLPGLDDGPRDMQVAVEMVRMAAGHGTRALIATPHAIEGLYATRRTEVLVKLAELREACGEAGLTVDIHPGQEVALVPDLAERLAMGELLTLGDRGRSILVELPQAGVPPYWPQTFFHLGLNEVTPIIAHAERTPLVNNEALAERMVQQGARLQINASVLEGRGRVHQAVLRWVRSGWVACLGSDGHDLNRRPPVLDPAVAAFARVPGLQDLCERPRCL